MKTEESKPGAGGTCPKELKVRITTRPGPSDRHVTTTFRGTAAPAVEPVESVPAPVSDAKAVGGTETDRCVNYGGLFSEHRTIDLACPKHCGRRKEWKDTTFQRVSEMGSSEDMGYGNFPNGRATTPVSGTESAEQFKADTLFGIWCDGKPSGWTDCLFWDNWKRLADWLNSNHVSAHASDALREQVRELQAKIDSQAFKESCANTPLMADVLARCKVLEQALNNSRTRCTDPNCRDVGHPWCS